MSSRPGYYRVAGTFDRVRMLASNQGSDMATDEIDLVDEILGPMPGEVTSVARAGSNGLRFSSTTGFALAFAVGAIASLALVTVVALVAFSACSSRVVPGVHIGSVDVSDLDRDQVIARLRASYAYLGQGEVSVTTPAGAATITYQQVDRAPDVERMADAAMRIGHTGNPIDDAVSMFRAATSGESVPIVVHVDPTAIATRVRQLVGTDQVPARNAGVAVQLWSFTLSQSAPGYGIDELALSGAIIDRLTQPDAPAAVQLSAAFVPLEPQVSDQDARDAIVAGQRMLVDVDLTWGDVSQTARPFWTPDPTKSKSPTRIDTIDAQTIRSWIVFGTRPDGSYGPSADPGLVRAYLSELSRRVAFIPPVEPSVVFDSSSTPVGLKGGKNGSGVDVAAASQSVEAYLGSLALGFHPGSNLAIMPAPIPPRVTLASVSGTSIMAAGKGKWTTVFYPDESNGFGANIRVPATILDGQVVAPGAQFSFLKAMEPIDPAHGFTLGGVIKQGKSDHTGAMGGGICSASTTMFNAAARAGLQIDERNAHGYYIYRYPVGLDATVFSNGSQKLDLKWTNDTPNPILIRARATYGSRSTITIELWSLPLDRKVAFSPEFKANVVKPSDSTVYVTILKPGQKYRAEYPTAGFATSRTRTVTDSAGNVIHQDTWYSHYVKVDGILWIGRTSAPPPTTPPDEPAPAPGTLTPAMRLQPQYRFWQEAATTPGWP
jgi:hypothetical protein